jgi:hypothetical protein
LEIKILQGKMDDKKISPDVVFRRLEVYIYCAAFLSQRLNTALDFASIKNK